MLNAAPSMIDCLGERDAIVGVEQMVDGVMDLLIGDAFDCAALLGKLSQRPPPQGFDFCGGIMMLPAGTPDPYAPAVKVLPEGAA